MKSRSHSFYRFLFPVLFVALTTGILSAEQVKGSFFLPNDTYWAGTMVPSGNYTFKLDTLNKMLLLTREGRSSEYVLVNHMEGLKSMAKSQLIIVNADDKAMANALYISAVNAVFWFKVPEQYAVTTRIITEARPWHSIDTLPVTVAGK